MAETLPDLALYESTLASISKSAESVANLLSESAEDLPSYPNGISLLSLKNSILLSYMHNMALLALCKLEGRSLEKDDQVRRVLVERLIRERVILEKIKPLEARLKYQVDKLVKKAEDADRIEAEGGRPEDDDEIGNDPLAFKPNLAGFGNVDGSEDEEGEERAPKAGSSGIYRPPRLAPLPYTEESRAGKKTRERPAANALVRDMAYSLTNAGSNPYIESTSGLGITPTLQSRKASKLADIERYEEENYTRVFMNKKDAKRRRMDEEDLALGGTGSREDLMAGSKGVRGHRTHGFENEFNDLLGGIAKKNKTGVADGYDGLRAMRRAKQPVDTDTELVNTNGIQAGEGGRQKRSKFDNALRRQAQSKSRTNKRKGAQ